MAHRFRFSIITIHRNGTDRLRTFLKSIQSVFDRSQDKIIVVDNHSTDESTDILSAEFPEVEFILNKHNMGYAYACNQGMAATDSEFILICNNDISLPPNVLELLAEDFLHNPQVGMVGGQLINSDGKKSTSAGRSPTLMTELEIFKHQKLRSTTTHALVEALVGAFIAVRRSVLDNAGALDPGFFFYFEETEWCMRVRRYGWQILFDRRLEIVHVGGASTQSLFPGPRIEYHRSRIYFWKKVFPNYYYLLEAWITLKMIFSSLLYLLISIFLLGQSKNYRQRLMNHLATLTWLALGKPSHWGLPDKPAPK
jgi:GT2 family glycosyltransferase